MALALHLVGFLSFGFYFWTGDFQLAQWAMFFYLVGTLEEIRKK